MRRLVARWADKRARRFRRELDLAYSPRLVAWRVWTGKEPSETNDTLRSVIGLMTLRSIVILGDRQRGGCPAPLT